jgi:hypothetical protein
LLRKYFKKNGLKSPTPKPFVGNLLGVIAKGLRKFDEDLIEKYGKTCGYFESDRPAVITSDLKFMKAVMIKDFGHFVNRTVIISYFFRFKNKSLNK